MKVIPVMRMPSRPASLPAALVAFAAVACVHAAVPGIPSDSRAMPSGRVFTGDFETGNLAQFDVCQTAVYNGPCQDLDNSDHHGLRVQTAVRRQGEYAARFEIRDGDRPAICCGERSEVDPGMAGQVSEGDDLWYQWSTLFDQAFPADHARQGWGLVTQWHSSAADGPPPVGLYVDVANGMWGLRINQQAVAGVAQATFVQWQTALATGTWHDMKLHIKFSEDERVGFVELWHNGLRQTFTGAPCAGQTRCGVRTLVPLGGGAYFKQGYYRDENVRDVGVVYHDGLSIARSEADLAPL